jgi:5-formyltetrahydrofolate cyclo-ligase
VAFESAKCDALPRGEFDLPLGAIVTESAVY